MDCGRSRFNVDLTDVHPGLGLGFEICKETGLKSMLVFLSDSFGSRLLIIVDRKSVV